jgi:hypothetical protein
MNHASGTVTPLDPELIQVGDAIGQRAQRRGLVQGPVRAVPVQLGPRMGSAQDDDLMPQAPGGRRPWRPTTGRAGPARAHSWTKMR